MRSYAVVVRNPLVALGLAVVLLAVGSALLVLGMAIVAFVVVAGAILGAGLAMYRRLRGRPVVPGARTTTNLNPSLEVFPPASSSPRAQLEDRTSAPDR